jgi:hypothetical protein
MDVTLVSAMSGVLGSLVGGSASVATTWIAQKTLSRREIAREDLRKREALYGEFIGECAKLFVEALTRTLDKPETLLPVYALINRIRLTASREVLLQAEQVLARITDQYFARNLTVEELRNMTHSEDADPLKAFGEACRAELKSMRALV